MNKYERATAQAACLIGHALGLDVDAYTAQLLAVDDHNLVINSLVKMFAHSVPEQDWQKFSTKLLATVERTMNRCY